MLTTRSPGTRSLPRFLPAFVLAALAAAGAGCGPSNGGVPVEYTVVFALSDTPEALSVLVFQVTYTGGDFVGTGTNVSCSLVDDDDETADFDDDDTDTLDVAIDATDENADLLAEGNEIVECDFEASTQPNADNFDITVEAAEDADGNDVAVGDIDVVVTSTDPNLVAVLATTGDDE